MRSVITYVTLYASHNLHISGEIILKNKAILNIELTHVFICQNRPGLDYREGNYCNKSFAVIELQTLKSANVH